MVKACILTGYGINADYELAESFRLAGAEADRIHVSDLMARPDILMQYRIVAFPGGFSFGDHLGSGLVLANVIRRFLRAQLTEFIQAGGLILGICNGFQVLVKCGLLPNLNGEWTPEVSLIHNDSGQFIDTWVEVRFEQESRCVWTAGLDRMSLPIRHGEGKFIFGSTDIRERIRRDMLVALRYGVHNPNGSQDDVAGITDSTGRVLGLMPHPEAGVYREQHPEWMRGGDIGELGLRIFENGVREAEAMG